MKAKVLTNVLWIAGLFFLGAVKLEAIERKVHRFSGKLIQIVAQGQESYIEYEDSTSLRLRKVFCDADTMKTLFSYSGKEEGHFVEGKATQLTPTSEIWVCLGKPNVMKRFSVGVPTKAEPNSKFVAGQVVEASGETGRIVYMTQGRRNYLTVAPSIAQEFQSRLEKMEIVEIKGNFTYDRVKRYYVGE